MFTFATTGSWMSCGKSVRMRVTASRTSSSASARLVSSTNSIAVLLRPSLTDEVTRLMPLTVATASSTLRVTSVSSWLGEAPGRAMVTVTIGKLTSGNRAIGNLWKPHRPATHSTKKIISAGSGRRIAQAEKFIAATRPCLRRHSKQALQQPEPCRHRRGNRRRSRPQTVRPAIPRPLQCDRHRWRRCARGYG